VAHVTIVDARHPLCGQRFRLNVADPAIRPGWVSITLADGRRRQVRRAATDLDAAVESLSSLVPSRVSVRTLLPLAQYVRKLLLNQLAHPDGAPPDTDQIESRPAGLSGPVAGARAEGVAGNVGSFATAVRAADRALAAPRAAGPASASGRGDRSC
jgi:hypothetical protein